MPSGVLGDRQRRAPRAIGQPSGTARALTASEAIWLAVVPLSLVAALAIAWLGPPLGKLLLASPSVRFWALYRFEAHPEPVEQGRYLVAAIVPLLFLGAIVLLTRLRVRLPAIGIRAVVLLAQALLVAFVAYCLHKQKARPFVVPGEVNFLIIKYFTRNTLLVAGAATLLTAIALRSERVRARAARYANPSKAGAAFIAGIAFVMTAVWLSHALYTETTIGAAFREVRFHVPFTMDETFAVLDGRTPLVNFTAQYGSLWPYAFAAGMALTRATVGVWIGLCVTATGLGMVAIYAVLRRAARSPLYGLILFLPVLATSFFVIGGSLDNRYTFANYYATFPIRYAGPSFVVWLVARHLGGAWPRRPWPLFLAAGIVALNNLDTGLGALVGTFAALLWTTRPPWALNVRRLLVHAAGGLFLAWAAVAVLTLARAGSLPDLALLTRFSRLFALTGFGMVPMRLFGLHVILYLTFVAALAVATVRWVRAEHDRVLTGTLAWSAVFGLGAGAYFVGRSTPDDLIAVFFPWAFALALLTIPSVRALRSASLGSWPIAATLCVFGFFVIACSLAQTPTPWSQVARLERTGPAIMRVPAGQRFVAEHTRPGEAVLLFMSLGNRIAVNAHLSNVLPYATAGSMPTMEQWVEAIDALKAVRGHKVFLDLGETSDEMQALLASAGFAFVTEDAQREFSLWSDGPS